MTRVACFAPLPPITLQRCTICHLLKGCVEEMQHDIRRFGELGKFHVHSILELAEEWPVIAQRFAAHCLHEKLNKGRKRPARYFWRQFQKLERQIKRKGLFTFYDGLVDFSTRQSALHSCCKCNNFLSDDFRVFMPSPPAVLYDALLMQDKLLDGCKILLHVH